MPKKIILFFNFLFLSFVFISCDDSNYKKLFNKDGVPVVLNKNKPNSPNLTLKLKKLFEIKDIYSDNNNNRSGQFVVMDSMNNSFIYNKKKKKIDKYDIQGNLIKTFAGSGYGPGEIDLADGIFNIQDTIVVWLPNQSKFNYYTTSGSYLYSKGLDCKIPYPEEFDEGSGMAIQGRFVEPLKKNTFFRFFSYAHQDNKDISFYFELSKNTIENDSSKKQIIHKEMKECTFLDYLTMGIKNEFYKEKLYIAPPSYDKFEVKVYNPNGELDLIIRKSYRRASYPKMMKIAMKAGYAQGRNGASLEIPDLLAIDCLSVDENGIIWVLSTVDKYGANSDCVFQLFSQEGIFLNNVKVGELSGLEAIDKIFFRNDKMFIYADDIVITENSKSNIGKKLVVFDYYLNKNERIE